MLKKVSGKVQTRRELRLRFLNCFVSHYSQFNNGRKKDVVLTEINKFIEIKEIL